MCVVMCYCVSRHRCTTTKEGDRNGARSARRDAFTARNASQHTRIRKLQPRNDGRNEAGIGGAQGHPQKHVRVLRPAHHSCAIMTDPYFIFYLPR